MKNGKQKNSRLWRSAKAWRKYQRSHIPKDKDAHRGELGRYCCPRHSKYDLFKNMTKRLWSQREKPQLSLNCQSVGLRGHLGTQTLQRKRAPGKHHGFPGSSFSNGLKQSAPTLTSDKIKMSRLWRKINIIRASNGLCVCLNTKRLWLKNNQVCKNTRIDQSLEE